MNSALTDTANLWPLFNYFLITMGLVVFMLLGSHFLGPKRHDPATDEPFESGIINTGSTRLHITIPFYLVAILFVIFDLEAVFLFAWAVSFREVGWLGFIEVVIFIGILIAALIYLLRIGALDWKHEQAKRVVSKK